MTPLTDVGFITMAFGPPKYLRQAETLALSLKRWMPGFKLALVTDATDPGPLFDLIIPMKQFETSGTTHKTDLYGYSPFEETLFIDSDCVVARNFSEELAAIREHEFSPVCTAYLKAGETDLWLVDVGEAISGVGGSSFPKFNGGVYFYRKGPKAAHIFEASAALRSRAHELGIKDFDQAGPGDETLIGLALSGLHETKLYNDGGRLMRTPLNSTGPVILDVLGGGCEFIKEGERVSPAICHFCGDWINHRAYAIAERELRTGRPAPASLRVSLLADAFRKTIATKLKSKFGGLKLPTVA